MYLNQEFITMPLIFATQQENIVYCNKHVNYIFLWNSPLDGMPVYLIKDTKRMEHDLILRMHSPVDFKTDSIETDVIDHIKKLLNES